MIDLVDLRVFARISDLKSISAAARALKTPKSSVSRSLARLEVALNTTLVDRSARQSRLTEAGMLLLPHALRILDDVNEAETALGSIAKLPQGTLRVNAPFTFAAGLIAPMLPAFLADYPEVRVVLDLDNRWIDVRADEADLVIRAGRLADSTLISRRLAAVELWACASPAYLQARGIPSSAADLAGHELIAWSDRIANWPFRGADGQIEHVEVRPRNVVPEPTVLQVVLAGGAGIGRLPDFLAVGPIARGELVRVLPQLKSEIVEVHALYPSHRSLSAKVRVFIDALAVHLMTARSTAF